VERVSQHPAVNMSPSRTLTDLGSRGQTPLMLPRLREDLGGFLVMAKYRARLPQLSDRLFLSDGGIETSLIYLDGFELPMFAAFDLFKNEEGREGLRNYFIRHASIAKAHGVGFILESPTWRANPDWASKLGYSTAELQEINREAIALMLDLRREFETDRSPMVISGCFGPRGDGYSPDKMMSTAEAEDYHGFQARIFADSEADMVSAITMNYVEEAVGIARAAAAVGIPSAISFTVETDGRLPTGQTLERAIGIVDDMTGGAPAYYMINCAHPTHFEAQLKTGAPWLARVRGLRANASTLSHAELDQATELDAGNPAELARQYSQLRRKLGRLNVFGGCCGTDHRHIEQIALACTAVNA
jgi:S-methylmethionine-dependent homocysteine/selenocysteine methylase